MYFFLKIITSAYMTLILYIFLVSLWNIFKIYFYKKYEQCNFKYMRKKPAYLNIWFLNFIFIQIFFYWEWNKFFFTSVKTKKVGTFYRYKTWHVSIFFFCCITGKCTQVILIFIIERNTSLMLSLNIDFFLKFISHPTVIKPLKGNLHIKIQSKVYRYIHVITVFDDP